MTRSIIYHMKDNTREIFEIEDAQHEQHERAHAEREMHDPNGYVKSYEILNILSIEEGFDRMIRAKIAREEQ